MADITNPWIGYFDRSYEQIKKSLLARLVTSNPEMTDHSEGNILVVLISMFAGVAEMIGLYIDTMSREAYLSTAVRYSSVVKLVRSLDYRIKSYVPSSVDITITAVDGLGAPVILATDYLIPINTRIKTTNNIEFITTKPVIILAGNSSVVAPTKQQVRVVAGILGITNGTTNQEILLSSKYADNTMEVYINSEFWELKDTLGLSGPLDKHYIIDINENKIPYLKFGNGTNGKIPTASYNILGTYYTTEGRSGNDINPGTIKTFISSLTLPSGVSAFTSNNLLNPSNGVDIEDIASVRTKSPLSIRTLHRAVTTQDFRDLLRLAPGVAKGDVKFTCGKSLDIYIVPVDGTIASLSLLDQTQDYLEGVKLITRKLNMKAAGASEIILSLSIWGRYRQDPAQIQFLTENTLVNYGSQESQNINSRVALSDIIALVDNIPSVDRVEVDGFYIKPYARPLYNNLQLVWQREVLPTAIIKSEYRITYEGSNIFSLYKDSTYLGPLNLSVPFSNSDITLTIQPGAYTSQDSWTFPIYPYGKTAEVDDYSMPRVLPGSINYTIIQNLVGP